MKVYDDKHIKNVAFVGANKSGKTTLAETMLFEAGLINRRGTVENKNTVSDHHEIEHEREMSVYATPLHTEWRNYKINILDTPGLDDFIGEIISSVRVSDSVVMVINAQHGVEVGTEIIWSYIDRFKRPTLFAINQIDHPKANFEDSLASLKNQFGSNVTQIQYPYIEDGSQCIIDVLKMKMYKFSDDGGKPEKCPIPDAEKDRAEQLHNELVEKAAENDEELMELYFDKGTLDEDEMRKGLKVGMKNHEIFPVFCLSALNNMGSGRLMGFIDNVAPAAGDLVQTQSVEGDDIICSPNQPTALFVFKTMHEPNLGQITYFKVKSGEVKQGDKLKVSRNDENEVLNQLYIMDGGTRHQVEKLSSGDIGATLKLKYTETNDTLYSGKKVTVKPIQFPEPKIRMAVMPKNKRDEEKITEVLRKIHSQDPTVITQYSREAKQLILSCQGELHLTTIDWTLKNVYGVEVDFIAPKVNYRETIQRSASSSYRHKKQSGGAGQFGEVHLKIEPYYEGMPEPEGFSLRGKDEIELDWGGKLVFYNCIVGGVIDQRYLPAITKGILEVMENGPLTGSYCRDVRVMVYDGKMHSVDSNEISFKIAGGAAFKQAFLDSNPQLLEPVNDVEVKVPEELMGEVMTELQGRRSIIQGMDSSGNYQVVKSKTPEAELIGFSSSLRSATQGRATFSTRFAEFSPVPGNIQQEVIKAHKKEE